MLWANESRQQGGYGCGKTHLAKCAHEFLRVVRDHKGNAQSPSFENVVDFLGDIKDAYAKNVPVSPLFDQWCRGPFILDDLGKGHVKPESLPWAREQFYRLIDRLCERNGFFLTSNLNPAEIENLIGGAAWSRLLGMCGPRGFIDMSAIPDYRLKKGGFYK